MRVILKEDVRNVGKKDQILNVSDGYARNFLFPKKLAIEANNSSLNELNLKKQSEEHRKLVELEESKDLAKKLEGKTIKIIVKTGDNGKLFGTVTNKEIAKEISEQLNLKVDKKKIVLDEPIKSLGTFNVDIKLHSKVTAKVKIYITEK